MPWIKYKLVIELQNKDKHFSFVKDLYIHLNHGCIWVCEYYYVVTLYILKLLCLLFLPNVIIKCFFQENIIIYVWIRSLTHWILFALCYILKTKPRCELMDRKFLFHTATSMSLHQFGIYINEIGSIMIWVNMQHYDLSKYVC